MQVVPPNPPGEDTVATTSTTTPVADGVVSSQTVTTSTGPVSAGWLSANLRNGIALALCTVVCYLAIRGHEQAQMSLVTAFTVLMGAIWGERASLKRPGMDA